MAQVIYTHCRYCGEQLTQRHAPYCTPCNIYLAYRAMPILLGMLLTGKLAPASIGPYPASSSRHYPRDVFPCRKRLCGVSPSVTELCECTASEC